MPDKISIKEFVSKSRKYAEKEIARINKSGLGSVTQTEAKKLKKDLADNFAAVSKGRSVAPDKFVDAFVKQVAESAKKADKNNDGFLNATEGKKLDLVVRDNFNNLWSATMGGPVDLTPQSRVDAHMSTYGRLAVGYAQAVELAKKAAIKDESGGETPRGLLQYWAQKNDGRRLSEAKADAKLKAAFKSLELLEPGEAEESLGEPAEAWIFRLGIDVGTDHGFWVSVDRRTGQAMVNGFN